ncbi:MAG: helix-turn-helix transcriptional regulator [Oscillatoriaceae bacterium SKW80]|nr:helix-turn-helix transcriptional regulator [Oscillatoriaceae bacterium SKYG93]MCX8121937.1 helix-turn-helix transcriptional regulator [Oscillatoriaceae bacterium SKW80]MDW8454223.1 helix-turn-helix transcriptional regulator [Oscillatoriaceae cyanobacterium SKYGB_i_bin93]
MRKFRAWRGHRKAMYQLKVKVKELCETRRWSLNELSRRSGVTYNTIRRYAKQSMTKIDVDSVCRLKKTFNCSWDELLEMQGDSSIGSAAEQSGR